MTGAEQRELGVLTTKMANLEKQFEEQRAETHRHRMDVHSRFDKVESSVDASFKKVEGSIQQVLDKVNEWKGGWKVMMSIAGITGAAVTFLLQYFQVFPPHK